MNIVIFEHVVILLNDYFENRYGALDLYLQSVHSLVSFLENGRYFGSPHRGNIPSINRHFPVKELDLIVTYNLDRVSITHVMYPTFLTRFARFGRLIDKDVEVAYTRSIDGETGTMRYTRSSKSRSIHQYCLDLTNGFRPWSTSSIKRDHDMGSYGNILYGFGNDEMTLVMYDFLDLFHTIFEDVDRIELLNRDEWVSDEGVPISGLRWSPSFKESGEFISDTEQRILRNKLTDRHSSTVNVDKVLKSFNPFQYSASLLDNGRPMSLERLMTTLGKLMTSVPYTDDSGGVNPDLKRFNTNVMIDGDRYCHARTETQPTNFYVVRRDKAVLCPVFRTGRIRTMPYWPMSLSEQSVLQLYSPFGVAHELFHYDNARPGFSIRPAKPSVRNDQQTSSQNHVYSNDAAGGDAEEPTDN